MKISHPHFPRLTRDVPDADGDRWLASGWVKVVDDAEPSELDGATESVEKPRRRTRKKA